MRSRSHFLVKCNSRFNDIFDWLAAQPGDPLWSHSTFYAHWYFFDEELLIKFMLAFPETEIMRIENEKLL